MRSLALIAVVGVCLASVACQTTGGAAHAGVSPEPAARVVTDLSLDPIERHVPSAMVDELDVGPLQRRPPLHPRMPRPRPSPDPIE